MISYVKDLASVERVAGQVAEEGIVVVGELLAPGDLDSLRADCADGLAYEEARLAADQPTNDLSRSGRRFFSGNRVVRSARAARFALSERMAALTGAVLGPDVYYFFDQYVIKRGGRPDPATTTFSWHQDSGYVTGPHRPFLTVWIALDDVDESNGTVYAMPYSQVGTRDVIPHVRDHDSNDLVADPGAPGAPVVVPAGGGAVFSSTVLHRSGPNVSGRDRRAFVVQYSAEPLVNAQGSLEQHAVPLLRDGRYVGNPGDPRDAC